MTNMFSTHRALRTKAAHVPLSVGVFGLFASLICAAPLSANSAVEPTNQTREGQVPLAPGYKPLTFTAPEPGSYTLPSLGAAGDGHVVESDGRTTSLHALYGEKIVLLSFIYSTCDDVNGCPLATAVFHKIKSQLKDSPELAGQLRLVTLSFNPEHDTPAAMHHYGQAFQGAGIEWRFFTTRSEAEIQPILQHYQQSVEKIYDEQGRFTGKFSHLLRVFLIDRQKRVRNIYTVSYLHPETVIGDIKTLLKESSGTSVAAKAAAPPDRSLPGRLRAGDDKSGYEDPNYRTRSLALSERKGQPADLYRLSQRTVLGLPKLPLPTDNPLSREKIQLGRKLFYDRRLSLNNTFSCAMCHIPEQGFTSQEQATAVGIEGRTVRRNSPTLYNVAYLERLFHDGRESSLENQVWGPLLASNEMGNPSVGFVVDKIKRLPDYRGLFERAFRRGPSMETVGQAIASYERALISGNSPFDRWRFGHQTDALSSLARSGFQLFTGKAGCANCHTVSDRDALFTDNRLHNTGLGYRESMKKEPEKRRVQVAPGIAFDLDARAIAQVSEARPGDLGLYEITQDPADRWKYRTPSLRNVALTAPYMHNGALGTLREVVDFYNRGGEPNVNLDPLIRPLNLSDTETEALVAFLQSLTGDNTETLVSDAYAAPVGDPQ
jgi:cytochrome c peroxidase